MIWSERRPAPSLAMAARLYSGASMEGNVLWASLELGLMDERLRVLADRLKARRATGGDKGQPSGPSETGELISTVKR